jgi:hypothetical protein
MDQPQYRTQLTKERHIAMLKVANKLRADNDSSSEIDTQRLAETPRMTSKDCEW